MNEVRVSPPSTTTTVTAGSYIEWSAVFGGALTALAVSFILLSFGAALGLSAVSPWTTTSTTATAVAGGAVVWLILVNIWAFSLGGYLAGRMRHVWRDAAAGEVEFRDGAHGLLVWALAITAAAIVAAGSAATIGRTNQAADQVQGLIAARSQADPVNSAVDVLLRPTRPTPDVPNADVRAETARLLLGSAVSGETAATDRAYLAQLVSARTGLAEQDAQNRLNEALDRVKRATDRARKMAILVGFLTAATLLLGAAAAWWGASAGGRHRDQGIVWRGLSRV